MKKIGIITISDNNNYGNRLQNYASQEVIKKYCDVDTIWNEKDESTIDKLKFYIKLFIKSIINYRIFLRYSNFIQFSKGIKYSKYKVKHNVFPDGLNSNYDYFVVGSDQVWNPKFDFLSDIELLKFADGKKRISFCASFGISNIPVEHHMRINNELSKFKMISVREDSGKKIIEDIVERKDVEVLVDPTMLLTKDDWKKVSKKPKRLKVDKYILCYFLGKLSESRKLEIERVAKEKGYNIINILDKNDPFFTSGPSEFLYLEEHAELICTDSFHSSVFAILYNRPFVVFNREDNTVSMNSRIETLISKFNLKNREYNGKNITYDNLNHDYTEAYKILEREREKANNFLMRALDLKEEN